LLSTGVGSNSQIVANDIAIRVESQSRVLRHGYTTIYRRERVTIELRFEIKVAPLDHRICCPECGRHMDRRQQTRAIIETMRQHGDIANGSDRKHLKQLGDTSHFGDARLNKVHGLSCEEAFEIYKRRRVFSRCDRYAARAS